MQIWKTGILVFIYKWRESMSFGRRKARPPNSARAPCLLTSMVRSFFFLRGRALTRVCSLPRAANASSATSSVSRPTRQAASRARHAQTTSCSGTRSYSAQVSPRRAPWITADARVLQRKRRSRTGPSSLCSRSTSRTPTSRPASASSPACSIRTSTPTASSVSTSSRIDGARPTTSLPS